MPRYKTTVYILSPNGNEDFQDISKDDYPGKTDAEICDILSDRYWKYQLNADVEVCTERVEDDAE